MIIAIAIILYLWAGATVVFALLKLEEAELALDKRRKPLLRDNYSAAVSIGLLWPLALPSWLVVKAYEAEGN